MALDLLSSVFKLALDLLSSVLALDLLSSVRLGALPQGGGDSGFDSET